MFPSFCEETATNPVSSVTAAGVSLALLSDDAALLDPGISGSVSTLNSSSSALMVDDSLEALLLLPSIIIEVSVVV